MGSDGGEEGTHSDDGSVQAFKLDEPSEDDGITWPTLVPVFDLTDEPLCEEDPPGPTSTPEPRP